MSRAQTKNPFNEFFLEHRYISLKKHLYNYLIRKNAIQGLLKKEKDAWILETGSGISPIIDNVQDTDKIIYSDISFDALSYLQKARKGFYVVADITNLPFKQNSFSETICSEVLEHVNEDQQAIAEMARTLKRNGELVLTVPHNKKYFSIDDRFVHHLRRYELPEIKNKLTQAGLTPLCAKKLLGPLDKLSTIFQVVIFQVLQKQFTKKPRNNFISESTIQAFKHLNLLYYWIIKLDNFLFPITFSSVVLIRAKKHILCQTNQNPFFHNKF
jgi:ubiquinone/menaquinone biosynthesis C-methylase UbiE